jgi:hypothetical protein
MKMKTEKYNIKRLKKHWSVIQTKFNNNYSEWINCFSDLIELSFEISDKISGRKKLEENVIYLLLTKAINHSPSALILMENGLIIDAALSTRNAFETFLLINFFIKDNNPENYVKWSNGTQFKPAYIRSKLKELNEAILDDYIIMESDNSDDIKFAYGWLSNITHSNIDSSNYTVLKESPKNYRVYIGGNVENDDFMPQAIFFILNMNLYKTLTFINIIYDDKSFDKNKLKLDGLKGKLRLLTKKD